MLREYIKSYLETDRSRSNKSNLIKLLISDKEKNDEINSFIHFGNFKQKLYHFIKDEKQKPMCLICKGDVKWCDALFSYRETCSSKCSGALAKFRKSSKIISHPILTTKDEYYKYLSSNKLKITESSISKYYPELIQKINHISFVEDFRQKVYCYLKDIQSKPVCKNCSAEVQFDTFSKGFHDFCSVSCSSNSEIKKDAIKKTIRSRYGVDNVGEVTRGKALETMIEKYGDHFSKTEQFKQKLVATSLERYNTRHYFQTEQFKKQAEQYFLNNFGVKKSMNIPEVVQKGLQKKKEKGLIYKWSVEDLKNYDRYRQKVTRLSEKNYNENIDTINPDRLQRGHLTFHLDHIYPVLLGFINGIDAELIADVKNLQILTHDENRNKSCNTEMTLEDFYNLISK